MDFPDDVSITGSITIPCKADPETRRNLARAFAPPSGSREGQTAKDRGQKKRKRRRMSRRSRRINRRLSS